jgi:hypothetical protein
MSSAPDLPVSLRDRLAAVARRVRRLRAVFGFSLLVLTLGVSAGAAVLADFLLPLDSSVRQTVLALWLGLGVAAVLFGLVLPLRQPLDADALAAVVEQRYPDLAERLTSSVELAGVNGDSHGSRALIARLLCETETQAAGLDFLPAVPGRGAAILAACAGAVVLLLATPALVWGERYADLGQRFFLPWDRAAVRGNDTPGETKADRTIAPLESVAGSPILRVVPPAYAARTNNPELRPEPYRGLVDLQPVLPGSELHFEFRFNRPAVAAVLHWQPRWWSDEPPTAHPLILADDRRSAAFVLRPRSGGRYRLECEAEAGVRSSFDGGAVSLRFDQPPEIDLQTLPPGDLTSVTLCGQTVYVRAPVPTLPPDDRLPIRFTLRDDVGAARAFVECQVGDKVHILPIPLSGADTIAAEASYELHLADFNLRDGDEIRYRMRGEDNLPPELDGPHVVRFPADGWLCVKVRTGTRSLQEQRSVADNDEVQKKLTALVELLRIEENKVGKVRKDDREAALTPDQRVELHQAEQDNQSIRKQLGELAGLADRSEELASLARQARDLADNELRRSGAAIQDAAGEQTPQARRGERLGQAVDDLAQARRKLEAMKQEADRIAAQRRTADWLRRLADRQEALAGRTGNSSSEAERAERKAEQQRLSAELDEKRGEQTLRDLADRAHAEEQHRLAEQARKLAQEQSELSPSDPAQAELRRRTEELMRNLSRQAADPERKPQDREALRDAADHARQAAESMHRAEEKAGKGEPGQAKEEGRKAAAELEKTAERAEPGNAKSGEPKDGESARQTEEALRSARAEMSKATTQLSQPNQKDEAATAMRQAARDLERAARQMTPGSKPAASQAGRTGNPATQPNQGAVPGDGAPGVVPADLDLGPHAGKTWGELPGEVRTRLLQEMKARYGEEHAELIRLYFERIADTRK